MRNIVIDRCEWVTEATLMAEVYCAAKAAGLRMLLEVKVPSGHHRSGEMRVDGAVVVEGRIVALVEGKRPGRVSCGERQFSAYDAIREEYGVSTHWINDLAQIPGLIERLVKIAGVCA